MLTVQNYALGDAGATSVVPAVLSVDEFITQNADLIGLRPGELASLSERLGSQPVRYTNVLDAIALLRTFLPPSTKKTPLDGDYALLICGQAITGFVELGDGSYFSVKELETRLLMQQVLHVDATALVLATMWPTKKSVFGEHGDERTDDIDDLSDALTLFGVRLIDWIQIHPQHNESYVLTSLGVDALDNGVTDNNITFHCTR